MVVENTLSEPGGPRWPSSTSNQLSSPGPAAIPALSLSLLLPEMETVTLLPCLPTA